MYSKPPEGGLLILSNLRDAAYFEDCLDIFAKPDWRNCDNINVLPIANHLFCEKRYLKGKIKKYIKQKQKIRYHVFINRAKQEEEKYFVDKNDNWDLAHYGNDKNNISRKIKQTLRIMRLDWFSTKADLLKNSWLRDTITEEDAERWINQFSVLNNHEWVGKNLLKALTLWPEHRVIKALSINFDDIELFDDICLSTDKPGKSADVLRNLISKDIRQISNKQSVPKITEPTVSLRDSNVTNILWIEDFLLSGTEASSLITSLLGETPDGRKPKMNPLEDPKTLFKKKIQFRYALSTDFGYKILEKLFCNYKLENCEIKYQELLKVLTPEGEDAIKNDRLFQDASRKIICDPEKHLILPAFQDQKIWKSHTKKEMAISFCKTIGKQLFENYINHQVENADWFKWPQKRIDQSALGMKHLGLALAFGHTVPKATLPLFWWKGPVCIKTKKNYYKKLNWEPLFPKTD